MTVYVPSTPSALARSKPRREIDGLTPGIAGQPAVERAVQHVQPPAGEGREIEPVVQPGCEPQHAGHRRMAGRPHRHSASHREAHEQRSLGPGVLDRRQRVLDAPVDPLPRLDPVAQLDEPEIGEPGCETADEPLDRRAPGTRHLGALAAVHADHREFAFRARRASLGTCREAPRDG